jgi:hypothetical protein
MEYMVSEKTDGVRHLMLITRDDKNVYSLLVDRGFRFYYTNVKFSDHLRTGIGTLLGKGARGAPLNPLLVEF